jgi:BMFP domain-containing protein YqiC
MSRTIGTEHNPLDLETCSQVNCPYVAEINQSLAVISEKMTSIHSLLVQQSDLLDRQRTTLDNHQTRISILETKDAMVADNRSKIEQLDVRVSKLETHKEVRSKDWQQIANTLITVVTGMVVCYLAYKLGWQGNP